MADEEEKEEYFTALLSLVVDVGTDVLLKVFERKIPEKENFESFLKANEKKIKQLKKDNKINDVQLCIINKLDIASFDISLLFTLLRNLTNIEEPLGGWNIARPRSSDNSEGASLIKLKIVRNEAIGHVGSTSMKKVRFKKFWMEAKESLVRLAGTVSLAEHLSVKRRIQKLENKLEKEDVDIRENVRKLAQWNFEDKWTNLQRKLSEHDDRLGGLDEIKAMIRELQADIEQMKQSSIGCFPQQTLVQPTAQPINPSLSEDQAVRYQVDQISQMMQNMMLSFYSGYEMFNRQNDNFETPITNTSALSDGQILEISRKIGGNWQMLSTYLGFTSAQQDALKFNYQYQLETLLHKMLEKWHGVVARTDEDVRWLLASAFAQIKDYRVAGDILQDNDRVAELRSCNPKPRPRPDTQHKIQAISFQIQPTPPNVTFNFGGPYSMNAFDSNINCHGSVSFGSRDNQLN